MNNLILLLKNLELHTKILIVIAVVVLSYSALALKEVHEINHQLRELKNPRKNVMQNSPNSSFLSGSDSLTEESDDILHYPTEGVNHDQGILQPNSRQQIIKHPGDSTSGKKTP